MISITRSQKSWIVSFFVHGFFILAFTDWLVEQPQVPKKVIKPIEVELYRLPEVVDTKNQQVVSEIGTKAQAKPVKPTSLPGDRKQPVTSKKVTPIYPKKALNNEWEGTVKLSVTISASGKPMVVKIVSSSGYDILDKAFIRAVKGQYQFKPKRVMGKNMVGNLLLSHTFSIKGQL